MLDGGLTEDARSWDTIALRCLGIGLASSRDARPFGVTADPDPWYLPYGWYKACRQRPDHQDGILPAQAGRGVDLCLPSMRSRPQRPSPRATGETRKAGQSAFRSRGRTARLALRATRALMAKALLCAVRIIRLSWRPAPNTHRKCVARLRPDKRLRQTDFIVALMLDRRGHQRPLQIPIRRRRQLNVSMVNNAGIPVPQADG